MTLDTDGFREWLRTCKGFGSRRVSDVCSHVCRANRILPLELARGVEHYLVDLGGREDFCALSNTVKSQLRHAARSYEEYCRESKSGVTSSGSGARKAPESDYTR